MSKIQMVDLQKQYHHIKSEIDNAIQGVVDSAMFINGKDVGLFASELADYLGVRHVIPCANGTDALQISLMALGFQPGDEVITPSFTFIATVEVVALLGLQPIFVDVDEDTFTMNIDSLKKAITPRTKAIIPVHLYGQCANMDEIMKVVKNTDIKVIEDNAQALGSTYFFENGERKKTGNLADIGCTSFFPSKNLGCYGDGGAIFTNDEHLADKMQMIAGHGQKVRYYHEIVGCNSRLDSIQAAVLRVKLRYLDRYCDARRTSADYYDKAFANHELITTPFRATYSYHVFHQYTLKLKNTDRDKVQQMLAEKGIPSMIYYPVPCHKQKMFESLGGADFDLPITDKLTPQVLSLPIHTEQSEEELNYIVENVKLIVEQSTK